MRQIGLGALVGLLLTAPFTAILYLANQLANLPFAPYTLFNWVARVLPGPIVTFGIDTMIDTMIFLGLDVADSAKTAERGMAIIQFIMIGVVLTAVFFLIMRGRQRQNARWGGIILGELWAFAVVGITLVMGNLGTSAIISIIWTLLIFDVWGAAVGWVYNRLHASAASETMAEDMSAAYTLNRRQFLVQLGASTATVTVLGAGAGVWLSRNGRITQTAATLDGTQLPNADAAVMPAPGTRPELTPLEDHYKVFLEAEPTFIEEADWILPVTGLIASPIMLTLDDIRNNYERQSQYVTLNCISGRVGTALIGTAKWSGVSAQEFLADLGLAEEAKYLYITSGDGFYESVALDLINSDPRIMFCYDWNDEPLPKDHGFPLRIWLPDRYGMKQPKWITGIEVTDEYREGYWVERNWSELAQVKTTSVVDTVALDAVHEENGQQLVPVGGIAYAGDRQISKVEVRVDGGEWQEAQLREPLSETTWVLWRYEWPFTAGEHTFEVRCAEGDGTPQIEEQRKNRPDGATGIDSLTVDA